MKALDDHFEWNRCVRIDGLDSAESRIPRQVEASKKLQLLRRPRMHRVCVIIGGMLEIDYLLDEDLYQDSNMECSLLSDAIDRDMKEFALLGLQPREHLILTTETLGVKEKAKPWQN